MNESGIKSDRSNKTSAKFESWVVGLQNFVGIFPYILGSYKTMAQQVTEPAEPAEPPEPVYFFFKRRGMCWVWSLLSGIKKNNLEEKYVLINHDVHFGMQLAVIYSEC